MERPIYWECINNNHKKFWAAHIIKKEEYIKCNKGLSRFAIKYILVRKWGRIGNKPQTIKQEFSDRFEAEITLNKLIWGKESKGYKPIF